MILGEELVNLLQLPSFIVVNVKQKSILHRKDINY